MSNELPILGILLAAGYSTRFGANKLLHRLSDGSLVAARAGRNLVEALPRSIAVVRPDVPEVEAALRAERLEVVVCANARAGMGASLACAMQFADDAAGYVIALADMPFIMPATIRAIAERLRAGAAKHLFRSEHAFRKILRGDCAFVSIAERFAQWPAVLVEANVVHGPAIDADRSNTFRS